MLDFQFILAHNTIFSLFSNSLDFFVLFHQGKRTAKRGEPWNRVASNKSDLLNFISIAQAAGLRNCNGAVIGLFSKLLRMF